jgi:hypothetical protein
MTAIGDRLEEAKRTADASWFLQNALGVQRWRFPESAVTLDHSYRCRDYFHGRGTPNSEEDCGIEYAPIQVTHVSVPYLSTSNQKYVVAISVPVWDDDATNDSRQVIGVLARTMYLTDLLQDYRDSLNAQGEAVDRRLALVDQRSWSLVAHTWMTQQTLEQINPVQQLRLDERVISLLSREDTASDRLDDYRDPVAQFAAQEYGGEWLAAFSPVGDTGWIAVVQEPKEPVLRPVVQLRERLLWSGLGGLALVGALIAGGWWMIFVWLSDNRPRWWPRRWRKRRAETTLTG